jgi:hypothetical protein
LLHLMRVALPRKPCPRSSLRSSGVV